MTYAELIKLLEPYADKEVYVALRHTTASVNWLAFFDDFTFNGLTTAKTGDVNGDGSVDVADISSIISFMAGQSGVMQGVPCSGGISEGEALVIEDISMLENSKDKILVTKMTDPGWVFYLASAKGVISQKGSILSHTAIISREIGIPSIVGVADVMNRINTGDIVRMDGSSGRIEILRRKE